MNEGSSAFWTLHWENNILCGNDLSRPGCCRNPVGGQESSKLVFGLAQARIKVLIVNSQVQTERRTSSLGHTCFIKSVYTMIRKLYRYELNFRKHISTMVSSSILASKVFYIRIYNMNHNLQRSVFRWKLCLVDHGAIRRCGEYCVWT